MTESREDGLLQIGQAARLEGRISGKGVALVHGELKGEIDLEGELFVAPEGKIDLRKGRVGQLHLEGRAAGRLLVEGPAELTETARLEAELAASRLDAAAGARLDGELSIVASAPESGRRGSGSNSS